jgi:hypothetical protein
MQRRWAAICLAFFLVTAAGAYGVSAVAEEPDLELSGDTYQQDDTLQTNGTTYTVAVSGGSGSLVYNETVSNEESFANNSAIEYAEGSYNVTIESADDPSGFALVEEFDVESILVNDSAVENQTYTADDGTQFVRYRNGTTQAVDAYLPEPNRETFSEGDSLQHAGESKTVDNVTASSVTVTWETEEEQTVSLAHGENATVGGTQYVATFPADDTVKLSEDVAGYQEYADNQQYFQQRLSGLNYVVIFSLVSAFLLTAIAFLPRRG